MDGAEPCASSSSVSVGSQGTDGGVGEMSVTPGSRLHKWAKVRGGHRCRRCALERVRVGTQYGYFRDGKRVEREECA